MATRVVCPDCNQPLEPNRLSCVACGALLASVADPSRRRSSGRAVRAMTDERVPDPEASPDVEPVDPDVDAGDGPSPEHAPATPTSPGVPDDEPGPAAPGDLDDAAEPAPPAEAQAEPSAPSRAAFARFLAGPALQPSRMGRRVLDAGAAALASAGGSAPTAAVAGAGAGAWLVPTSRALGVRINGELRSHDAAAASLPSAAPGAARSRAVELTAPRDATGWLLAVGSTLVTLGFFLPWAPAEALGIGSGYLDRWGLAAVSHLAVLAGAIGLLGLALVPNRVPGWLRTGVLPLVGGGIVLGIVWPFLVGGLGGEIGSLAVGLGGVLLLLGGILGVHEARSGSTAG